MFFSVSQAYKLELSAEFSNVYQEIFLHNPFQISPSVVAVCS